MHRDRDPGHWLYRFSADEWMAAARNELSRAADALARADRRKGLFEARRAAGMALNAWLHAAPDPRYGRSYMDHLAALVADDAAPADVRAAGSRLLEKPTGEAISLVGLRGLRSTLDLAPAEAAERICAFVAASLGGASHDA